MSRMSSRLSTAVVMIIIAMKIQMRAGRGSPAALIIGVVQPAVLMTVSIRVRTVTSAETSIRLVIGIGLLAVWGATVWTAGAILRREAIGGTLAANVTGAWSPALVLFGKSLGATVRNVVIVVGSTVGCALVLNLRTPMHHPWWFLLGLLGVLVSGVALGMLLSCIFLLSRYGDAIAGALMYVLFILGGVIIPASFLPQSIAWLSYLVSLRWAEELLVESAAGDPSVFALAALFGLAGAYGSAAAYLLSVIVDRARRRGSLELT
jgi:ABC-2 type transport system permease protein